MADGVSEWEPSVRELSLAECLASGLPLTKACAAAGVPYRTGQNWYQGDGKPEFIALVRELRQQVIALHHEKFANLIQAASRSRPGSVNDGNDR